MKILYEDRDLLVVHKESGLAVQTAKLQEKDLVSMLKNHLADNERTENAAGKAGASGREKTEPYLAVINRLDQPVEGIVLFAKNAKAAAALSDQQKKGMMEKYYYALCDVEKRSDSVDNVDSSVDNPVILVDYLLKNGKTNTSTVVPAETPDAKLSKLSYEVLGEWNGRKLVKIRLFTGRHHQIRVQMSHHGLPLTADNRYNVDGVEKSKVEKWMPKGCPVSLCAAELHLQHPSTKEDLVFAISPRHPLIKAALARKS